MIARDPQEKDASHELSVKFQGPAVSRYVEVLLLLNLTTWVFLLCKDSKSHYGINVFIFK